MILLLGEVIESRSGETGSHVRKVSEYAYLLARKTGMGEDEAATLRTAAALHDIGKIAIPDSILMAPRSLSDSEFVIMKKHSQAGYRMLAHQHRPLMQLAAQVALEHHEWWDGTGYPQGLKGKGISLPGRLVAIADVFEALLNDRVYRPAWMMLDVLEYMKTQTGKQFDPELMEVFLRDIDDFVDIHRT
jgi:HD-GYP domain-containing protein (c-di-GMP phosphodiesterase class II)